MTAPLMDKTRLVRKGSSNCRGRRRAPPKNGAGKGWKAVARPRHRQPTAATAAAPLRLILLLLCCCAGGEDVDKGAMLGEVAERWGCSIRLHLASFLIGWGMGWGWACGYMGEWIGSRPGQGGGKRDVGACRQPQPCGLAGVPVPTDAAGWEAARWAARSVVAVSPWPPRKGGRLGRTREEDRVAAALDARFLYPLLFLLLQGMVPPTTHALGTATKATATEKGVWTVVSCEASRQLEARNVSQCTHNQARAHHTHPNPPAQAPNPSSMPSRTTTPSRSSRSAPPRRSCLPLVASCLLLLLPQAHAFLLPCNKWTSTRPTTTASLVRPSTCYATRRHPSSLPSTAARRRSTIPSSLLASRAPQEEKEVEEEEPKGELAKLLASDPKETPLLAYLAFVTISLLALGIGTYKSGGALLGLGFASDENFYWVRRPPTHPPYPPT